VFSLRPAVIQYSSALKKVKCFGEHGIFSKCIQSNFHALYKTNLRSRFAVFKHGKNVDIKPLLDSKDDLKIALNFLSRLFSKYFLF
jgi:hypothetical protein